MVIGLHNALLSMTPHSSRATIHVNYTVIFIFSICNVLFVMIECLISIMFCTWLIPLNAMWPHRIMGILSLHNNEYEDCFICRVIYIEIVL